MAVKYRVSAKTGTYTDREGKEKSKYVDMGVVVDTRNGGLMMILEAIPVGWDGSAFLNEPRERTDSGNTTQQPGGGGSTFDDDIPY